MIFFITGPSSCGKSFFISKLQQYFQDQIQVFSSDVFFKKVADELKTIWSHKVDWTGFSDAVQEEGFSRWISHLNEKGQDKIVLVDDIVQNVSGYLHEITCPFRIFLLGVPLKRFFLNLKRRKNRKGGQVLQEIIEYYEPSLYPTPLSFTLSDLQRFSSLKGYSQHGVKRNLKKAQKHFFQEKDHVYIRPTLTIPIPVSVFISEDHYKKIKNYIKKRLK